MKTTGIIANATELLEERMTMERIREQADKILQDLGLLDKLKKYGTPHVIGSYSMNTMAWNDLDIDVSNEKMDLDRLYQLTDEILRDFHPTWYEAKQVRDNSGKTVWFHGFEAYFFNELWNVDIWFFDDETIRAAERFCDRVGRELALDSAKRSAVIRIKEHLIAKEMYPGRYTSMDVYHAVLGDGIRTVEDFLARNSESVKCSTEQTTKVR